MLVERRPESGALGRRLDGKHAEQSGRPVVGVRARLRHAGDRRSGQAGVCAKTDAHDAHHAPGDLSDRRARDRAG